MILILGDADDVLVEAVDRQLALAAVPVIRLGETELAQETPFAFSRLGNRFSGFLRCRGQELQLQDISGVLVRLPRRWWPDEGFDTQDQLFVFHETTAALFALLAGLSCPVVNRYGLGWWVRDESYPTTLFDQLPGGPRGATEAGASAGSSVYLVGRSIIAASGAVEEAARRLAGGSRALADWQRASGISICRLGLTAESEPTFAGLDLSPSLQAEPRELVERVAAATLEVLS